MVEAVLLFKNVDHLALAEEGGQNRHVGVDHTLLVGDVELPVDESAEEVPLAELQHFHGTLRHGNVLMV